MRPDLVEHAGIVTPLPCPLLLPRLLSLVVLLLLIGLAFGCVHTLNSF
jgi:hypothetical protein